MKKRNSVFDKKGYYLYKNALSTETCDILSNVYHNLKESGKLNDRDTQVPDALLLPHNDELLNAIHEIISKKYEDFLGGMSLVPSYFYGRYYLNGNILHPHRDRSACELSATLTIDYDKEWPLWIEDFNGNPQKVLMERGDLVFYHGCDLTHWRESFDGKYAIQLFLHYVNANNSEADNIKKIRSERKDQDIYIKNNNRMRITKSGWPWLRIRKINDKK